MDKLSGPLPDFEKPPVVEVALSVQFETLTKLGTPQIGALWQEFREEFPETQEHPPLDAAIERFGVPASARGIARIQMLTRPPIPRCWFLNPSETELIQVQPDRFIHNWRKVGEGDEYPRYERLRKTFKSELERFCSFLEKQKIGLLSPNQCEVTYVNHIPKQHGALGEVLTVFKSSYSDSFLTSPEDARLALRHVITDDKGEPLGRLHVSVEPAYQNKDNSPIFVLTLTSRGRPTGDGIDGVLGFFDLGRRWIVKGFASITTDKVHQEWGRKHDRNA